MEGYYDGWKITEEQMQLINRRDGSEESKAAFEQFFNDNFKRIFFLARKTATQFFRCFDIRYKKIFSSYGQIKTNEEIHCGRIVVTEKNVIEIEDLLNSLYTDWLSGYIEFKMKPKYIAGVISHSFRYAPVGGLEGCKEYKFRGN